MLFGITIQPVVLVAGGTALFLLLVFQMLVGKRKIKFKGPLHPKVHRWAAYLIMLFALVHAVAAMAFLGIF